MTRVLMGVEAFFWSVQASDTPFWRYMSSLSISYRTLSFKRWDSSERSIQLKTEDKDKKVRVSIWSVSERWLAVYFGLFTAAMLAMLVFVIWTHVGSPPDWVGHIISISGQMSLITVWIVAAIYILTEVINMLSNVVSERYLNRRYAKGKAEGKTEGFAEANLKWESWLERKEAAEAEGRDFTELPPSRINSSD